MITDQIFIRQLVKNTLNKDVIKMTPIFINETVYPTTQTITKKFNELYFGDINFQATYTSEDSGEIIISLNDKEVFEYLKYRDIGSPSHTWYNVQGNNLLFNEYYIGNGINTNTGVFTFTGYKITI